MSPTRPVGRVRTLAGLLVVWTVAWSTPAGQLAEDTKNDLYLDAWGLMRRALHLWDPQVTWGVLQNQGYGYLFPMGPFYAVVGSVVPVWVTQRLWWTLLLTAGYLGTLRLLRALGVGTPVSRQVGALAYALCPRVVTELGGLSAEALPVLLAPWILLPLVRAHRGELSARRAAAYSGLAVLACGGVNAAATLLVLVPAGLWLVVRRGWWRAPLTGWWLLAVACACAWWAGPLLVLGRYSPPFLDWIETARVVMAPVGLLDVVRGTTHWLQYLVTPGGPWWPAGYALASRPGFVVATALVAGVGLAGLASRGLPHRTFLVTTLVAGVVLLGVPHTGPVASPLAGAAQHLLDGSLVPFRNIHKADPLVRLPLVAGLAHLLGALQRAAATAGPRRGRTGRRAAIALVGGAVVWGASPGMTGLLAPPGTFERTPAHWVAAGRWLSAHETSGRALLVPGAGSGEYMWGRTVDEPLRPLTTASFAVRDGVPLTPANTIRFLDAVEQRLQSGRSVGGAVDALLASGVRYLALRNDLDPSLSGAPPVALARSALLGSGRVRLAASFGPVTTDLSGADRAPVEIYVLDGSAAPEVRTWPAAEVTAASGASESLLPLADAGFTGPVVFDGDAVQGSVAGPRVETDGFRARRTFFGTVPGRNATDALTARQARGVPDYLPWDGAALRTTTTYAGIAGVEASSSIAGDSTFAGIQPAFGPGAAVDGDPRTAWLTSGDRHPVLTVHLGAPRSVAGLTVRPYVDRSVVGNGLATVTRVRVSTDGGSVVDTLSAQGTAQVVATPPGPTSTVRVEVLATRETPVGSLLTGLADVAVPGVDAVKGAALAAAGGAQPTAAVVLTRSGGGTDGCVRQPVLYRCLSGVLRPAEDTGAMARTVRVVGSGSFTATGTLEADPLHPSPELVGRPGVTATATSRRTPAPESSADAAVDGDPATAWSPASDDDRPALTVDHDRPVTVTSVELDLRDGWALEHRPVVAVTVDGATAFARLGANGVVHVPARTGRTVAVAFVPDASDRDALLSLEVQELRVDGRPNPAPSTVVSAPCGAGPVLRVGGTTVPTAVTGTRDAVFGASALRWRACAPVRLSGDGADEVVVEPWRAMVPAQTVLRRAGAVAPRSTGATVPVRRDAASRMTGRLGPGPERLLALTDNTNPGWRASVAGHRLRPVVVDGFRQGFVVPAGAEGALRVEFGPDVAYRRALGGGACLVLLLLAMAGWPTRRSGTAAETEHPAPRRTGRTEWAVAGSAVLVGGLLAGPWGLLVAAAVVAVLRGPARTPRARLVPGAVALAVLSLGAVQAVVAPGSLGPVWLQVLTRLGCVAALAAVVGSSAGSGRASERHGGPALPPARGET